MQNGWYSITLTYHTLTHASCTASLLAVVPVGPGGEPLQLSLDGKFFVGPTGMPVRTENGSRLRYAAACALPYLHLCHVPYSVTPASVLYSAVVFRHLKQETFTLL